MEDLEDLTTESSDQESVNEDLTAGASSDRQIDESPGGMTASRSSGGNVDESLYDEIFENSAANNQLENIDNLYDVLMETPEINPELFSEPVLIGLEGKEFEATLAEPFSPFDSTVSLLSAPNCPQTNYKVDELDYLGLISRPKQLADMGHETISEVLETIDGKSKRVEVPIDQDFETGVFCHSYSKASRFQYFFFLNNSIKLRYRADRIGEILLESELISKPVLDEILVKQKNLRDLKIGPIVAKLAKLHPKKIEQVLHKAWRNQTGNKRIFAGDILVKSGIATRKQVEKAHEIQAKLRKKKIGEMLIESGSVNEDKLYSALAEKFRKPFIDLKTIEPSENAKSHLPRNLVLELMILPLSIDNGHLVLATSRPEMTQTVEVLRSQLECPFDLKVAAPSQLKAAIIKKYGN
ncbi:MAG: hypothetical protein JSW69_00555 [Deltaproteobacteria bacterium]|nr:MAG: hypothetical protein JSW69_00555 [Deltaproteobacteria bacterium]